MKNIAVLISGSGSNLQALIDACASSRIPDTRISLVFSNRKAAHGLVRASSASPPIPTDTLALQPFLKSNSNSTRTDYDIEVARRVLNRIVPEGVDLVVLAGFMHVLSGEFLDAFSGLREYDTGKRVEAAIPIINLHPALPGAFDGTHSIERALEAFKKGEVKGTGVMVHRVVKEVDRGEPVLVCEVEIQESDNLAALEDRIHQAEHDVLIEAVIKLLAT